MVQTQPGFDVGGIGQQDCALAIMAQDRVPRMDVTRFKLAQVVPNAVAWAKAQKAQAIAAGGVVIGGNQYLIRLQQERRHR